MNNCYSPAKPFEPSWNLPSGYRPNFLEGSCLLTSHLLYILRYTLNYLQLLQLAIPLSHLWALTSAALFAQISFLHPPTPFCFKGVTDFQFLDLSLDIFFQQVLSDSPKIELLGLHLWFCNFRISPSQLLLHCTVDCWFACLYIQLVCKLLGCRDICLIYHCTCPLN